MDFTEIKSENGQKGNRIVLRDLTKRQKELMLSGGVVAAGIGIGSGIFSLYSLNEPDQIPQSYSTQNPEEQDHNEEITLYTDKPVATVPESENSFAEAFKVARHEVGAGGWFIFKDKVYNTYYKEEWENLSNVERQDYMASIVPENSAVNEEFNAEPELAVVDTPVEENHTDEAVSEPSVITETDSVISNIDIETLSDNEVIEVAPEISVSYITEISDEPGEEITENEIEVNLPEDNLIYEVSIEEQNTFESELIDASDIITFGDDTLEVLESITPIAIHNLEDTLDFGLEADLLTDHTNDIQEYPWGEPVNPGADPVVETFNNPTNEIQVEPLVIHTDNASDQIDEYPWGEPVIAPVKDKELIADTTPENVQSVDTIEEIPTNLTEEYPWGEPVIDSVADHTEMTTTNLHVEAVNPIIIDAELNQEVIEEYPWGEPVNDIEHVSVSDNIKVVDDEELISIQVQEIHPTIDATDEYPWGEPMEQLSNQTSEETSSLFDQDDLHNLNNPLIDSDPNF